MLSGVFLLIEKLHTSSFDDPESSLTTRSTNPKEVSLWLGGSGERRLLRQIFDCNINEVMFLTPVQ